MDRDRFQKMRAAVDKNTYQSHRNTREDEKVVGINEDQSEDTTEKCYYQEENDVVYNAIQQTQIKIASRVVTAAKTQTQQFK